MSQHTGLLPGNSFLAWLWIILFIVCDTTPPTSKAIFSTYSQAATLPMLRGTHVYMRSLAILIVFLEDWKNSLNLLLSL